VESRFYVSRVEGLEFIRSEGAGLLTEPGDLNDLKEALFELVTVPEKRADMGQRGLKINSLGIYGLLKLRRY